MARSNYPFLKRIQEEEKARMAHSDKPSRDMLAVMAGAPLSYKYAGRNIGEDPFAPKRAGSQMSSFYTGNGEDGQLQPNKPTHMLNTNRGPQVVDEGERVDIKPSGDFQVTPASQLGGQNALDMRASAEGMPRYQTGKGFSNDGVLGNLSSTLNSQLMPDTFANNSAKTGTGTTTHPVTNVSMGDTKPTEAGRTSSRDAMTINMPTTVDPNLQIGQVGLRTQPGDVIGAAKYAGDLRDNTPTKVDSNLGIGEVGLKFAPGDVIGAAKQAGDARDADNADKPFVVNKSNVITQGPTHTREIQTIPMADIGTGDTVNTADTTDTTDTTGTTIPSGTQAGRAVTNLENIAQGVSPAADLARERLRSTFKGEEAAANLAGQMQASQLGLSDREAMTEAAMRRRGFGAQEAQAMGMTEAQRMQNAQQAALALPGASLNVAEFEARRKDIEGTQEWTDFLNAAEYGDDATVKAAYEKAFGRPMTDDAMVNDIRNYARTSREQALTSADLGIEGQRLNLDTGSWNLVKDQVSSGANFNQVKDALMANGGTEADAKASYDQMVYNSYGFEQEQYQNGQDWAQIGFLMDANDYSGAAAKFNELTGGGVDMSRMEDFYSDLVKQRNVQDLDKVITDGITLLSQDVLGDTAAKALGTILGKASTDRVKLLLSDDFSDEDWNEINSIFDATDDLGTTIDDPKVQRAVSAANAVVADVEFLPEWRALEIEKPELFNGESQNNIELGRIAAAVMRQNEGRLNEDTRSILKKYNMYDEANDVSLQKMQGEVSTASDKINAFIDSGDIAKARAEWDRLPASYKVGKSFNSEYLTGQRTSLLNDSGKIFTSDKATLDMLADDPTLSVTEGVNSVAKQGPFMEWRRADGRDRAEVKNKDWWRSNAGKVFEYAGKKYVIVGVTDANPNDRFSVGHINVYDMSTGGTVKMTHLEPDGIGYSDDGRQWRDDLD